ncbi:MAG: hypothetical protein H7A32_02040 [Deltaproteobacteria bacterium]|nr:hypothetical protein [Deltaproteobacteria bacterium]
MISFFGEIFFSRVVYAQALESQVAIPRYELALREVLDIQAQSLRNFVVTIPNIIKADRLPGDVLRIEGVGQGRTFIHVWDAAGRHTYEIEVLGFGRASVQRLKRKGYSPKGAQLSYRMRTIGERRQGVGWRDPLYEHEFEARVPVNKQSEWYTIGRASTNTRVLDGPTGVPFSQATEPTYILSYYRTPRFTLALGDASFTASELSVRGFPFRGALFEYHKDRDRAQVFAGWSRPLYGFGEYLEIQKPRVYGFSGTKEVLGNVFFHNSFVFLDQDGATDIDGTPFEDDYIYTVGMSALPIRKNIYIEGEYGRSKLDNSMRILVEWRPYWGNILAYYRRIGTNYVDLSRGFLINDFQEGNFSTNFQPTRRLNFNVNYRFNENGLASDSSVSSKNHSVYLTGQFDQNDNVNYISSFTLTRSQNASSSYAIERGSFMYNRYFDEHRRRLYAELRADHSHQRTFSSGDVRDNLGGNFDARYRHFLNKNFELIGNMEVFISRISQSSNQDTKSYFLTNASWGPEVIYTRENIYATAGFNHSFTISDLTNSHFIQPFLTAVYKPNSSLALEASINSTYDFIESDYTLSLLGQLTYRFGPGIADTPFSSKVRETVKVIGKIFFDNNVNGIQDEDENLVTGLNVRLNDKEINANNGTFKLEATAGRDELQVLLGKEYESFRVTTPNPLKVEGIPGETVKVNFGLFEGSLLVGRVLVDENQNLEPDQGEFGPAGIQIKIFGQGFEKIVTTNPGGRFSAHVPKLGSYQAEIVKRSLPVGYQAIGEEVLSAEVSKNQVGHLDPFFIEAQRSVYGIVFMDTNKNGIYDEGEQLATGVQISIGEEVQESAEDGGYIFRDLPSGKYKIKVSPQKLGNYQLKLNQTSLSLPQEPRNVEINIPYQ